MRKWAMMFLVVFMVSVLSACAIGKASIPIRLSDGTETTASITYGYLFTSKNISYMPLTGFQYASSEQLSNDLIALEGLATIAGKIYGQSQGIPVGTVAATQTTTATPIVTAETSAASADKKVGEETANK